MTNPRKESSADIRPSHSDESPRGELPPTHLRREDDRWDIKNQLRDWGYLLIMILVYLAWTGIVYWFEPGIR
ncbi:MAG: hypothetical protein KatS3mg050_2423 [Litorilinea sp.]|nr:MAG: hypothetical protein KatS3mg050_2423 [Litorilinea sp.]